MMDMLKHFCRTRSILALDITNFEAAVNIANEVLPYIDAVKIGIPSIIVNGLGMVEKITRKTGLPVLVDVKIADVPHIAEKIAHLCFGHGAEGITVHGFVGPSAIEACVKEAGSEKDVFVITEITHVDASVFMENVAETIAKIPVHAGASGIQAPGNRPDRVSALRKIVGIEKTVIACGMGFQGGEMGSALKAGADFELYGRSIYEAHDPAEAAKQISIALNEGRT